MEKQQENKQRKETKQQQWQRAHRIRTNTNRSVLVRLQLYNKLGTLEGSRNKQLWEGGGQRHSTYGHKHSALTVDCYCC